MNDLATSILISLGMPLIFSFITIVIWWKRAVYMEEQAKWWKSKSIDESKEIIESEKRVLKGARRDDRTALPFRPSTGMP